MKSLLTNRPTKPSVSFTISIILEAVAEIIFTDDFRRLSVELKDTISFIQSSRTSLAGKKRQLKD